MNESKPLMSVCFTCYNRAKYVKEAFESVLAQTYTPLEICVVDDGSTDGTFELVESMAQTHRESGGLHSVRFCEDRTHVGVVRNFERGFKMARGEIIVVCGDDDISLPTRVEKVAECYRRSNGRATVIFSDFFLMDIKGKRLTTDWWTPTVRYPLGAVMAYSPLVVKRFKDIFELNAYEDGIFARRAYAFGDPAWIDEKLLYYRLGTGLSTSGGFCKKRQKISRQVICSCRQTLADVEDEKALIAETKYSEIRELAYELMDKFGVEYGYNPFRKFFCYVKYCKRRNEPCFGLWGLGRFLVFGYPMLGIPLHGIFAYVRSFMRGHKGND